MIFSSTTWGDNSDLLKKSYTQKQKQRIHALIRKVARGHLESTIKFKKEFPKEYKFYMAESYKKLSANKGDGIILTEIEPGGVLEKLGLKVNDRVVRMNNVLIGDLKNMKELKSISIIRNGNPKIQHYELKEFKVKDISPNSTLKFK
jgi:C-terminal processing protease CtpA/Prc